MPSQRPNKAELQALGRVPRYVAPENPTNKIRRAVTVAVVGLVTLAVGGFTIAASLPVPVDSEGKAGTAGPEALGGLKKPMPEILQRPDNKIGDPRFAERAALGRLLFYDPILSKANDMSCATCHHPDLGYADDRRKAIGAGGRGIGPARTGGHEIRRGTPTIWNAAFNATQFWDGRAKDLEDQARNPITAPEEMGEDAAHVGAELAAVPVYAELFDRAFGGHLGSSANLDNVTKAIAAFERTQLAMRSPFDKYAAGDVTALSVSQRRGLALFRSGKARCFECHQLPTFSSPDFKVIGVPPLEGEGPDQGRFEVSGEARLRGAFKVPTLRNVALTAPYMHNGRFATLEEVVDFYSKGGGPGAGHPTPNVDDKIRAFALSSQERIDLVDFLASLTDESALADIPRSVPSTLPVVPRVANTRRAEIAKINTGVPKVRGALEKEIVVKAGESIQSAVDRAAKGATIRVMPGVYSETVLIDVSGIKLVGVSATDPGAEIKRPVLDGRSVLSDAVIASGLDFSMENFEIRKYAGNGVVAHDTSRVQFRNLRIDDTGLYGLYPVRSEFIDIRNVEVTGVRDAGIYVGQSKGIVVENCVAHGNVTGIEIENSVDARVENNHVYDNAGGILVFALPGNPSKEAKRTRVARNRVIANNHRNFGDPAAIVSKVPSGGGIFVLAADDTEITENEIRDNKSFGVAVLGLDSLLPGQGPFDVGAFSDRTRVHGNTFEKNGFDADPAITAAGLKGADLLWDVTGPSNTWDEKGVTSAVPVLRATWPAAFRRVVFQLLTRLKS